MDKHRMDLANQVDQSRKVKQLEAALSRMRSQRDELQRRLDYKVFDFLKMASHLKSEIIHDVARTVIEYDYLQQVIFVRVYFEHDGKEWTVVMARPVAEVTETNVPIRYLFTDPIIQRSNNTENECKEFDNDVTT